MIPFMKRKDDVAISAPADRIHRKPDDGAEEDYDGLEACMSELSAALKADDAKAAAIAFRSACELVDSQPHKEGEHI